MSRVEAGGELGVEWIGAGEGGGELELEIDREEGGDSIECESERTMSGPMNVESS